MAHEFVSGAFIENEWHGLGVVNPDFRTPKEMFAAGLADFQVVPRQIYTLAGGIPNEVEGFKAIVREDTGTVLSVATNRYTPVQNTSLIRLADALMEVDSRIRMEAVTVLRNSQIVTFTAGLPNAGQVGGDEIGMRFTAMNSHDAKRSLKAILSMIRVVCANTWQAAQRDADSHANRSITIKHSAQAEQLLNQIPSVLDMATHRFTASIEEMQAMLARPITMETAREALKAVFADELARPIPVQRGSDELRPRQLEDIKAANRIVQLFRSPGLMHGDTETSKPSTAYRLFQCATHYSRHDEHSDSKVRPEGRRYLSNLLGNGADLVESSREACLALTRA